MLPLTLLVFFSIESNMGLFIDFKGRIRQQLKQFTLQKTAAKDTLYLVNHANLR